MEMNQNDRHKFEAPETLRERVQQALMYGSQIPHAMYDHARAALNDLTALASAVTDAQTPEFRERVLEIARQLRSGYPNRPTQREAAALIEDWYLATRAPEPQAETQEDGPWIGCRSCDVSFHCHNGKAACMRLPQAETASQWVEQNVSGNPALMQAMKNHAEAAEPQPDSRGQAQEFNKES